MFQKLQTQILDLPSVQVNFSLFQQSSSYSLFQDSVQLKVFSLMVTLLNETKIQVNLRDAQIQQKRKIWSYLSLDTPNLCLEPFDYQTIENDLRRSLHNRQRASIRNPFNQGSKTRISGPKPG